MLVNYHFGYYDEFEVMMSRMSRIFFLVVLWELFFGCCFLIIEYYWKKILLHYILNLDGIEYGIGLVNDAGLSKAD